MNWKGEGAKEFLMATIKANVPWWHRASAQKSLEAWAYPLIRPRLYLARFNPGGGSYVDFTTRHIAVDPLLSGAIGGEARLPVRWGRSTITTLARLQWRCSQMAAWHEDFHVLFTDPGGYPGILRWLVNALEDERIERLARWYYPPAWAAFRAFGRLMAQFKEIADPAKRSREQVLLDACLYMRWDWKRPRGAASRFRFHDALEEAFWREEIFPLVQEAWAAPHEARVGELARDILDRIGVPELEDPAVFGVMLSPIAFDTRGKRDESDRPLAVPGGGRDEREGAAPGTGRTPEEDEPRGEDETGPPEDLRVEEELYLLPPQYLIQTVRGEVNALLKALIVPTPEIEDEEQEAVGLEFSVEDFVQSRGEFPFRTPGEAGRAHGGLCVVLFIDMTTSMGGWPGHGLDELGRFRPEFYQEDDRMTAAREAALLFELVCPRARIPLAIGCAGDNGTLWHLPTPKNRSKLDDPVTWIRTFQTPRLAEMPRFAIAGLYGKYNRERVSPSLRIAAHLLEPRREETKLVIYIHDGVPEDEPAARVVETLAEVRKKGILVAAPYVGDQGGLHNLQDIFGKEWTIPVPQHRDLSKRMARFLLKHARSPRRW